MSNLSSILKPLDNTFNKHEDALLLGNNSCIYIINGRRGSGKSTLLLNILNSKLGFKKRFDNIYFVSPTARTDKKFSKLVKELDEDGKFHEQLSEDLIENILSDMKQDNDVNDKKHKHLLILDDCVLDIPTRKQSIFNKMIITSRHLCCSVLIVSQKYNALPTIIRANADLISFFPSLNSHETRTLQEDINIDKDLFYELYDKCCEGKNDFLHINLLANPPVFYKSFEKIEF
jgi:hypothetical protein